MTTPSHTELAARLRETAQSIRRKPMPLADFIPLLQQAADALESPERVLGEAVRTQLEWFALAAHWHINASDRELAEQGQARGDALKQVHLLSGHLEASGFKFATPSPQAEKQPLSDEQIFHARNWLWKNHGVSFSDRTLLDLFELVGIVTKESST